MSLRIRHHGNSMNYHPSSDVCSQPFRHKAWVERFRFSRRDYCCLSQHALSIAVLLGSVPAWAQTEEQVTARAEACFWPYHREVDRQLDRMTVGGRTVCMLVMHSFPPEMKGFKRPWHVGVLWNDDPRLPAPLLDELRKDAALVVGDNEPYSARASYEYTLTAHARPRALPHCSLEVRQDLMDTPDKARQWGRKLAGPIGAAIARALG